MKQNKYEVYLYSTLGVAVMFLIVIIVNVLAGAMKVRVDMTEFKLYTLSDGTRKILQSLEGPVEIRLYRSEGANMPAAIRTYARTVEDLLHEMEQTSGGNISIKTFSPEPDTDQEDLANMDGIQAQFNQSTGDSFYLGLAVSQDPNKVALGALTPGRQELLEYDLARAISQVTQTNKPVVGVMTPLPMFGQPMNPMMMRMGQQAQRPWVVLSELQRTFEVRQVPMDTDTIDPAIKILFLAHPKEISEKTQYAIDQFVLRGGKLMALLDGKSVVDRPQDGNPMSAMMGGGASNLDKLLKAWGLTFETTQVVADKVMSRELSFQRGAKPQAQPAFLFLNQQGVNREDVATAQIDNVWLPFCGSFSGEPAAGLNETVLLHSTSESQLVDPMTAQFNGQKVLDDFRPAGKKFNLAVRLQGKFKTAFPDGKPADTKKEEEGKEDQKKEEPKPAESLKESDKETVVMLFGDSDFVYDNFCVEIMPLFNVAQPINQNLALVQNLMEQLAGDINLIGARSRAGLNRPFTRVQEMQARAGQRFQDQIKKLEEEKAEAEKRLGELQAKKDPGQQQFILSKEQQEEIANFRKKQAQANKTLRQVRKDLKKDEVSLQTSLKWMNIAGMPLLVTMAGLGLAVVRKQRTRAK